MGLNAQSGVSLALGTSKREIAWRRWSISSCSSTGEMGGDEPPPSAELRGSSAPAAMICASSCSASVRLRVLEVGSWAMLPRFFIGAHAGTPRVGYRVPTAATVTVAASPGCTPRAGFRSTCVVETGRVQAGPSDPATVRARLGVTDAGTAAGTLLRGWGLRTRPVNRDQGGANSPPNPHHAVPEPRELRSLSLACRPLERHLEAWMVIVVRSENNHDCFSRKTAQELFDENNRFHTVYRVPFTVVG